MKVADQTPTQVEKIDFKNYEIGSIRKVFVGEPVISRKSYKAIVREDSFKATNNFTLTGGIATTSINVSAAAGDTFRIAGYNELNNPVVNIPGSHFMFGINPIGHWDKTVMSPSFWTSPIGSGNQYKITPENTVFKKNKSITPISEAGYINHEIIFTGINANGINILYREYTFENMARSDFKQEVVYPADSKQVRFKNYLLEILSVTSSEITFSVVKD